MPSCASCKGQFAPLAMQLSPSGETVCQSCGSKAMLDVADDGGRATSSRGAFGLAMVVAGGGVYASVRYGNVLLLGAGLALGAVLAVMGVLLRPKRS